MSSLARAIRATRSREVGLYVYSKLGASLIALMAVVIAARVLDAASFAYIATLLLIFDTSHALGSFGLPDAVFYFVGRDRRRGGIVVRQAAFLLAVLALPAIAVACTIGWQLSTREVDLLPSLPWLAIAIACAMPAQAAVNQLLACGMTRGASSIHAAFAVLLALAIIAPVVLDLGLAWTAPLIAATSVVRLVVHVWLMRFVFPRTTSWLVRGELREMLSFAGPAGIAALCGTLNVQIDKYVVNVMLPTEVFALYSAAAWELPLVSSIPYAIGAVMQVTYVELHVANRLSELHALWMENVGKTALVVFPFAVFAIACAPEILEVVFGHAFVAAALPFQLFSAVLLHRVASYGAMLQATNQTRQLLISSALLVGTNAALVVPFTAIIGAPGAALATTLSCIPPWLWTLSRIAKAMGVRIRDVMPWCELARTLVLVVVIGGLVAVALPSVPWPAGPRLAIGAVVFGTCYLVLGRAFRVLSRDDLAFISRWLRMK